jgi:hypothetical protein
MTKEEFEQGYIDRSGITKQEYDEINVTMSCDCGDESCSGWAAISNNELSINAHLKIY